MDSTGRFLLGGALGAALGYLLSQKNPETAQPTGQVAATPVSPVGVARPWHRKAVAAAVTPVAPVAFAPCCCSQRLSAPVAPAPCACAWLEHPACPAGRLEA